MKKLFLILFVMVLALAVLTACAPTVQGFVELPEGVKTGITSLVTLGVAWAFVQLVTLLPWLNKYIGDYKEPIALGLAAFLIDTIQNAVPDLYGNVAIAGLVLLLAIFEVVKKLSAKNVRGFRAR